MNKNCTIFKTASFIGKRWTLLILLELYKGQSKWKRYSDLKKKIEDITPKILSLRLRELEKEKMITKKIDATNFPIKCEYSLTKSGEEFINIIKQMKSWALKWNINHKNCNITDCKDCEF
ncbi:MAG: helix-turn-helix domain-containing protein [archaeon]